jgi:hypothetical protein
MAISETRGRQGEAESAHPLLGLGAEASNEEILEAYWRLHAHIETRAAARASEPGFAEARRAELEALEAAARGTLGPGADLTTPPRVAREKGVAPRWIRLWAMLATAAALGLAAALLFGLGGEPEPDPLPPLPARLSVRAEPLASSLQVFDLLQENLVAEGPADGSPQSIEPGGYLLRVHHEECPDEWTHEVTLAAGQALDFAPRICEGSGALIVRSNVSGDRVQIDGLDVGSTGSTVHPLDVGGHDVRVEKQGYAPWTGRIATLPDQTITLQAELTPIAKEQAAAKQPTAPGQKSPPAGSPDGGASRSAGAPPPPPPGGGPAGGANGARAGRRTVPPPPSGGGPARTRATKTGKGGSKSWHDAIKYRLVTEYDRNGSGTLDTPEEVSAITCEVWRSVEESYETGGLGVDMTHLYGFDGSDAPANTLGITKEMRGYAYDRMKQCGLKTRR